MTYAGARPYRTPSLTTPLAVSLAATGIATAWVCNPPTHLYSWQQVASLATLYLFVAACVHIATVWTVHKITSDVTFEQGAGPVLPFIWGAWIAVVWLPLLALLTKEHSAWVAVVLPVVAMFGTLLTAWCTAEAQPVVDETVELSRAMFRTEGSVPLGKSFARVLSVALALNAGITFLALDHAWIAGCFFAAVAAFFTWRLAMAKAAGLHFVQGRSISASAGNTVAVWLFLSVALLPFLVGISSDVFGLMAMAKPHTESAKAVAAHTGGNHYVSMILFAPPKPHPIVVPKTESAVTGLSKPKVIPFDGAYWYFQEPDTRPSLKAHITKGDPITAGIHTTNQLPLIMEAHQPLHQALPLSCCRSLRVDLVNGDTVPGSISVEVMLVSSLGKHVSNTTLGTKVLRSSTVSPMPLNRAAVNESLTFHVPREKAASTFDEIAIRIKPDYSRTLAGAKVRIESFALQP